MTLHHYALSLFHSSSDNSKLAVIIELMPQSYQVLESVGAIQYCLTLIVPEPTDELPFEIFVDLETVEGTAST